MADQFSCLIGRKIKEVTISQDKTKVHFKFLGGSFQSYRAEGECCSYCWIEHLEMPDQIEGAVIMSVEQSEHVPWDNHKCGHKCGHEGLDVYHTTFKTDKGEIILEYRNDSHGYYGGSLEKDACGQEPAVNNA
jgi:hypothetical protein